MYAIIAVTYLLAGWAVRRKAADVLTVRKRNRRRQARRRFETAHRSESWRQILEVRV